MTQSLTDPQRTVRISLALCLPTVLLLFLMVFGIEPDLGPLHPLLSGPDGKLTTYVPIAALLLLPVAFFLTAVPLLRRVRVGGRLREYPLQVSLATVLVAFAALLVAGFVIDQYPCWMGVPNCD